MTAFPSSVDLLIVGSGPVGATFARTVTERVPSARVLMVELGPQLTEPLGLNVRNVVDPEQRATALARSQGHPGAAALPAAGDRPSVAARPGTHLVRENDGRASDQDGMPAAALSSNVGGMGAHWTCACPSPGPGERIAFIDDADWQEVWREAERLLDVTTTGFPETPQGQAVLSALGELFAERLPADRQVQRMPLACRPTGQMPHWAGADTVLGPLVGNGTPNGFELRAETICRRLIVDGDRVTGAVVEHLPTGTTATIAAMAVAVAADALRTPQLLWASGIRPAALGRYLNDQPQCVAAAYLDPALLDRFGVAAGALGAGAGLDFNRDHLTGVSWVPFSDPEHPYHGQVMQLDASPIAVGGHDDPRAVVGLGWFSAKEVRAEDRVEFTDEHTDAYGMPAMTIHYGLTERDHDAIAGAMAEQRRVAVSLGGFVPGAEPRLLPAGSSLHYQGTVRMGADRDGSSVCDSHSRVWGLRNLFVGGNGVIPTATASNPTATSVALAVRACERIAESLTSDALEGALRRA